MSHRAFVGHAGAWALALLCCAAVTAAPVVHEASFADRQTRTHALPVPEGSYRVTLKVAGPRGQRVSVLAEQRRFMAENVELRGGRAEVSFVTHVRRPDLDSLPANAPGGTRVKLAQSEERSATWDDALNVEIVGEGHLVSVRAEPEQLPTLYLVGDSTVTDRPNAPDASWGQLITRYVADSVVVSNHARSGESLKSFVTSHRLDKVLASLRPGDWVMIQFGHNDQKTQWQQTFADAATTYRSWLRVYVDESRRRGATPIFVTSPERRNFDIDGRIRPTLAEYASAMREVAREQEIALIDLQTASIRVYESLGPALSPRAFADGGDDRTHHNEYGARLLARAVIQGLRQANPSLTAGLEKHIAPDAGEFDVTDPPLPETNRETR